MIQSKFSEIKFWCHMKIRTVLYAAPFFLAISIAAGSYVIAGSTLELTQKPREISGIDRESSVAFAASLTSSDNVVIDVSVGGKQIHADIDYKLKTLSIRSLSKANGASAGLSDQDIAAFQNLLVSLPRAIDTSSRHGDALTSFVNLMASAPAIDPIDIICFRGFTPICDEIGGTGVATYKLKRVIHNDPVQIGPVCYMPPAKGRCGAGAGPDPAVGLQQRFTQECLNHDQCCAATKDRILCKKIGRIKICANVCGRSGKECMNEFKAACNGFFFAPDCGTTAGNWTLDDGSTFVLTGGESTGEATAFSGTVNTIVCGTWDVAGTRTGTNIVFTATNTSGAPAPCVASATYSGAYNNCNTASGSWTNTAGSSGTWSWTRTNTEAAQAVSLPVTPSERPWLNGPANRASVKR